MAGFGNGASGEERLRKRWEDWRDAAGKRGGGGGKSSQVSRLKEVEGFGSNPGRLTMLAYAPPGLPAKAPLVVVLHGCTQDARGYDAHAGWTALAEREGFAVLYPEQQRGNNPQKCFNWFQIADTSRGLGESLSIREMIDAMAARHRLDAGRIYVVGLSAGGAMAASLLGDYPEVFAGGAVIAGLPCGAATSMQEAFEAMSRPRERSADNLGDLVRASSTHPGPWPTISIWHGSADATVAPRNADALVKQWLNVHGAAPDVFVEEDGDGYRRRVWRTDGRPVVESYLLDGMGHGTPVDGRVGERRGPFMLDVGVSSTRRIADFWGILPQQAAAVRPGAAKSEPRRRAPPAPELIRQPVAPPPEPTRLPAPAANLPPRRMERPDRGERAHTPADRRTPSRGVNVGEVIAKALRAAGLMR